jgi:hypothetical protein
VVECLPGKCNVLSSNPTTSKSKKKKWEPPQKNKVQDGTLNSIPSTKIYTPPQTNGKSNFMKQAAQEKWVKHRL